MTNQKVGTEENPLRLTSEDFLAKIDELKGDLSSLGHYVVTGDVILSGSFDTLIHADATFEGAYDCRRATFKDVYDCHDATFEGTVITTGNYAVGMIIYHWKTGGVLFSKSDFEK